MEPVLYCRKCKLVPSTGVYVPLCDTCYAAVEKYLTQKGETVENSKIGYDNELRRLMGLPEHYLN